MEVLREALYAAHGLPGTPLPLAPEALLKALTYLDEALERLAKRADLLALEVALLGAFAPSSPASSPAPPAPSPAPPAVEKAPLPEFDPLAPPLPPRPPVEAPQTDLSARWRAFLEALRPTLRAFVREARPVLEGKTLFLRFPEGKAFHHKKAEEQREALWPLIQAHFGVAEVVFLLEKKTLEPSPPQPSTLPKPSARIQEPPSPPPPAKPEPQEPAPLEEAPWEAAREEAAPEEDPGQRLAQIARLLGARLLWVRRPKALEAEEPVSEDGIGGSGI